MNSEASCGAVLFFLTTIWLPHRQLWAIIEGTASLTAFSHFRLEGHRESRSEVGSPDLAERPVGLEPGTFRF